MNWRINSRIRDYVYKFYYYRQSNYIKRVQTKIKVLNLKQEIFYEIRKINDLMNYELY